MIEKEGEEEFPGREVVEETRVEVKVLEKEVDERVLDQTRWSCVVLEIANAHIFLLIDMMLQNEDLKSFECNEDMKDHE